MTTNLGERYLPGLSIEELALTSARMASATAQMASSAAAVAAASEQAWPPFARIVEAHRVSSQRFIDRAPRQNEGKD